MDAAPEDVAGIGGVVSAPAPAGDSFDGHPAADATGSLGRRGWLVRRALAAADVIALLTAFALAEAVIHDPSGARDRLAGPTEYAIFALSLPGWLLLARQYGLYARDEEEPAYSTVDDVLRVFNMLTVGTWSFFILTLAADVARPSLPKLILFWGSAIAFVSMGRAIARGVCRRTDAYRQKTIVFGADRVGQLAAWKFLRHPEFGVDVVGFVDDDSAPVPRRGLERIPHLGCAADLARLVAELEVERVVVAFPRVGPLQTTELVRTLGRLGVHVDVVPRLFELADPHLRIHAAEGLPLIALPPARWSRSALLLKRALDLGLASLALLVLLPLFAVIAVAIRLDSHGPAFFRQVRMGAGGRPFRLLKFRTMVGGCRRAEARGRPPQPASRRGRAHVQGLRRSARHACRRLLRSYSIDEFPQLFNVLRGEMSLVGPRPLILDEDRHVDGWRRRRLDLSPG